MQPARPSPQLYDIGPFLHRNYVHKIKAKIDANNNKGLKFSQGKIVFVKILNSQLSVERAKLCLEGEKGAIRYLFLFLVSGFFSDFVATLGIFCQHLGFNPKAISGSVD